jgi:hypothetical protein
VGRAGEGGGINCCGEAAEGVPKEEQQQQEGTLD